MNYSKILRADIVNSINGFTCSLFVSGCGRHCNGCFNSDTWNPCFGKPFDEIAKNKIFDELSKSYNKAFSFLGGEPLSKLSDNRETTISLAREIKKQFPSKTIYLWSGYLYDEIKNDDTMKEMLNYVDVLIDGPFKIENKSLGLILKGSRNQTIRYIGNNDERLKILVQEAEKYNNSI